MDCDVVRSTLAIQPNSLYCDPTFLNQTHAVNSGFRLTEPF